MSRFFPGKFTGRNIDDDNFAWEVIVHDGRDIGTIWLEKDGSDCDVSILGILIGEEGHWGRGIGREAIALMIREARGKLSFETVRLNVRRDNKRAISCYKSCGFRIIKEGSKTGDKGERIDFFTMEKSEK